MNVFAAIMLTFAILNFSSCQSAYRIKPENFATQIDKSRTLSLFLPDQTRYQLADIYERHQGTVVFFWQSSCPCVKRYQARINELFAAYSPLGLAFINVFSNTNESFSDAHTEYARRHIALPLMRDENGELARLLGAKGTPSAALIDTKGDVVFMGWIDNERPSGETGRHAYLEDAIKQYLAGMPITAPTSPMFGCPIR